MCIAFCIVHMFGLATSAILSWMSICILRDRLALSAMSMLAQHDKRHVYKDGGMLLQSASEHIKHVLV